MSKSIGLKTIIDQKVPWNFRPLLSQEAVNQLKTASSIALAILATAGIITLSAAAPNVIGAIGRLTLKHKRRGGQDLDKLNKKTSETFYYLKRSGLINIKPKGKDFLVNLTRLGRRKVAALDIDALFVPKPKKWDKKWWLVAADIPTKSYRQSADLLRKKLKELNFYPFQRTLWVYPHDPRKELQFILQRFNIERFATLMEINRLDKEDEKKIKKFFKSDNIL